MKIIQNTLKIEKKISNVSKKNWVGPKKVGLVGFPDETFFFLALYKIEPLHHKLNDLWLCSQRRLRSVWALAQSSVFPVCSMGS